MQAMPQAKPSLSSFQLTGKKGYTACSTFSSLLVLTHWKKTKKNKRLHYTLNTLHQKLHNALTIHSKHAKCHKSLNSQTSISLSLSLSLSLPQIPPVLQQPNHMVCHVILWLVGVVLFSTNRKGSRTVFFFLLANTTCLRTLCEKSRFDHFFLHQTRSKRDGSVRKKAQWTLFIISLVLVGLSKQFKNCYIVWGPHQHIHRNWDSWRLRLAATSC